MITDQPVIAEAKTINAIETHYAGCRFRSRLEARWAVFFDTLGIEWQYEPQGYLVGPQHTSYLPDFWLPGLERWVEVKGLLTAKDFTTLLWAASEVGLPGSPDGADSPCLEDIPQPRILLLGQIHEPDEYSPYIHWRFDRASHGRTVLTRFFFGCGRGGVRDMQIYGSVPAMGLVDDRARDAGFDQWLTTLTDSYLGFELRTSRSFVKAIQAARSARFEHGERG